MTRFLTTGAAIAALLVVSQPASASIQQADLAQDTFIVASEDVPVWGPLRGHANPQCPAHVVCPKPTIFF